MNFKLWLENQMTINGITFVLSHNSTDEEMVLGNVTKIDASFKKDVSFYITKEKGITGRYTGFQEFLKKGVSVEVPEVSIWEGEIAFSNGRHRFAVLRDMGFEVLPFAVHVSQVEEFKRLFR